MIRNLMLVLALLGLAACGGAAEPKWAPEEQVQAARYVHPGPSTITLYTVLSNRNDSGAHSGLLINGTERVIFDPAGTWHHPRLPERNDIHFGMTDRMVAFYIDYHARETFRVMEQTIEVPQSVASLVMQRAKAYGAVPKAHCANAISSVLSGVPGFENVSNTFFPNKLAQSFGKLPGVKTRMITDDDADDNHGVLLVQAETEAPAPDRR